MSELNLDYAAYGFIAAAEDWHLLDEGNTHDELNASDSLESAVCELFENIEKAIPAKLLKHFEKCWFASYGAIGAKLDSYSFGYDTFSEVIGSGTGVWDRVLEGDKDYKLVRLISGIIQNVEQYVETYIGDDGEIYWFGKE